MVIVHLDVMVSDKRQWCRCWKLLSVFFLQAEDGIRDLVRSRGLGDVYKRQGMDCWALEALDRPCG